MNSIANIINRFTQNILQLYTYRNLGFLSPDDCSSGPASEQASGTAAALEDLSGTGGTFEAFSGAGLGGYIFALMRITERISAQSK